MNLRKVWLIAKREYTFNFRRRSFLFAAFGVPLITLVMTGIVITVIQNDVENINGYKHVGIVDQAGILTNTTLKPPFEIVASQEAAQTAIANNALDGYFVIPSTFKQTGRIEMYSLPTHALSDAVQERLEEALKQSLAVPIGDASLTDRIQDPLGDLAIYRIGSSEKLDTTALVASFLAPLLVAFLIFMTMTTSSQTLMQGMVEEKETRMLELFVTSSRISEILAGKILGLGALGLSQIAIWIAMGVTFATLRGVQIGKFLADLQLTPTYILLILIYFLLGYLCIGGLLFGIGASVGAEQESRQIGGLITMLTVLPFMLTITYFTDANGPVPLFLSIFPLTSPVGMLMRAAWTEVPPLQIVLSLALLAISVAVIIWLAAAIFRLGMLNYGKRLSPVEIFRSIREGRQTVSSKPKREAAL